MKTITKVQSAKIAEVLAYAKQMIQDGDLKKCCGIQG